MNKNSLLFVFILSLVSFSIWNSVTTWWLHYAKKRNGSIVLIAYLFPVCLNSFMMSFVFTLFSCIKRMAKNRNIGYICLVCLWILFEKLHLEWELSWPWLNLGNGFSNRVEWIQWYEYTGTLGGTLWIWLVNIGFLKTILKYQKEKNHFILYNNILINLAKIFLMICLSSILYIQYGVKKYKNSVDMLILQPNIDPYHQKYHYTTQRLIYEFQRLMDKKISKNKSMIVVAPETAFPGYGYKISINEINKNRMICLFKRYLKKKSPKTIFITGIELFAFAYKKGQEKYGRNKFPISFFISECMDSIEWINIFNSVIQIGAYQKKVYYHHKSKLVPAVEIFPYKDFFSSIFGDDLMLDFGGGVIELGKDNNISVFQHPYLKMKIAPIICYESVFGEYVSKFFRKNAGLMVIITNDGWWGKSQGHKQHLYYARLRAIENRKCIARSANTGVSCFINERGDILSMFPYGKKGFLYRKISVNNIKTFYTKHGDYIYIISFLIEIIIISYAITYYIFRKIKIQIF